jgi:hypothetical protein
LRSWITTEVADASGPFVNRSGKIFRREPLSVPNPLSMRPVLAEKAVEGASVIEDSKVFKSIFRTITMGIMGISSTHPARTDPICYAIGWETIIIPTDISLFS